MKTALIIIGIILIVLLLLLMTVAALLFFVAYSREIPAYGKKLLGSNMESDLSDPVERVRVSLAEETEKYIERQDTEEVRTLSYDGLRLFATLLPGSPKSKKIVIAFHGYHSSPAWDFGGMVQFYHERGYHVLLPDNRGHRKSEGRFLGFGWLDRKDVITWSKKMARRFGPDAEILLTGVSMGGAAVMMASGEPDLPKEVKAIVEDCGFSGVIEQFEYMFPDQLKFLSKPVLFFANLFSLIFNRHALYGASSVKQLKLNQRPTLFIHGEKDDFVPAGMLEQNYEASAGVKDYMLTPGAKHAQSTDADLAVYQKKISDFLYATVGWDPDEKLIIVPKENENEDENDCD